MQQTVSKDGYKALINKAFDVAEAPLQNWISYFTGTPVSELFEIPATKADSVWLRPEKKKGSFIEFKIKVVDKDYKHNLGKLASEQKIKDVIQFLAYSITTVYVAELKTIQAPKLQDISIEWDPSAYIGVPRYTPLPVQELNKNKKMVEHMLSFKTNVMGTGSEEKKKEWNKDYNDMLSAIKELEPKVSELADLIEEKNKYLSSCKCIGISVKKYKPDELPKGMFMNNLPKIQAPAYK